MQILLRRKRDGVERKIEHTPGLLYSLKHRFQLAGLVNVTGQEDGRSEFPRERLYIRLALLASIGDREFCTQGAECFGASVGNRMLVGDAENEPLFTGKRFP